MHTTTWIRKSFFLTFLLFASFSLSAQNQALDLTSAGNEVNVTYNLNTGPGFTVEQWVYLPTITAGAALVNQSNGNFPAPLDAYVTSDGRINLLLGNGTASFTSSQTAAATILAGTWHHVALVYDPASTGTEGQIFIDGNTTPAATVAEPAGFSNAGPIRIGRRADAFEGDDIYIDEVRIWSVPRTGTAIGTDFDAKLHGGETGLDVYLQFENNLLDDATGNGPQDGSIAAGSIGYVAGAPLQNNALNFDGVDDRVSIPRNSLPTGLTFEAWVNTVSADAASGYAGNAALSVIGDVDNGIRGSFGINGGQVWYLHWTGTATDFDTIQSVQTVNDGAWHHIAVTHDQGSNEVRIYIDGQLDGQGITATYHGDMSFNRIGSSYLAAVDGDFFDGSIDEVRVWDNVRTLEQINADAYTTLSSGPGLIASFDFNQGVANGDNGSYTTLPDLTINANDGTLNGPFALNFATSNWVPSTAFNNDIFDPLFISGYPLIDNITTTGFDITVQLNEPGTYFYVVVPDGATPPSVDDVRGGTGFGGTGQVAAGNIAVTTASTNFVLSPTALTPNTFYDVYIVAQDDEGSPNVQNTNTVFDVTTEAGFVTRWITSDNQITIPTTGGGYNYSVEWNNITNPGTNEGFIDGRTGDYTITGMENGSTYEVIIRGAFPRIYFNNVGDKDKIQSIEQWGNISWTFFQSAFYGCSNLTYNATDAPDLSGVSGLGSMFRNATSFNATDLTSWDVSGITDMGLMFSGATAFAGNVSSWDVSNVVTMTEVFRDLPSFNSDISGWVTTSASNMSGMFQGSSSFNRDLSGWDLNGVSNTSFMFFNASSFDQDLSLWDVTTVSNMTNMLSNTAISVANYDAILSGWAAQSASLQVGVTLGATGLGYSSAGETDRNILTTAPSSWTISGDQLVTPAAPTNLIAYATSATDITLDWTDNATNETGYLIERADDYAFVTNVQTVTSLGVDASTHVFNAGTDQPYYYRVTPTNSFEDASSRSAVEFATTKKFAGEALSFNGSSDHVSVAHDPGLNLVSSDFTIEAWVYLNASGNQTIASKGDGNGIATADAWIFQIQGDKIALQLVDGVSSSQWGLSTTNVPLNEWAHAAVSFTGTTATFYLNGVADGTHNYGFSPSDNGDSQSLYIGRQGTICNCNLLDGDLDELKIWNAVKSDFSDRFNAVDLSVAQPNLVAYYPFDEGVGASDAVDASANINDGILSGTSSVASTVVQDGVVSNTNDSGPGSLREAINYANANSPTTITFNIPGGGPYNIGVTTTLPDITAPGTIIDGTSQPGWTFGDANNMVAIDGSGIGSNSSGFNINEAADVEIYGLIITGFSGLESHAAIELTGDGSDRAVIGAPTMGNIIHGGGTSGIYITNSDSTVIRGNWIGTLDGSTVSGNSHHGISATGTVDNLIIGGNFSFGEGNVISGAGNGRYGITTSITGTNLSIKGNYIGTDASGNNPMNNEAGGIDVGGAVTFVIGGVGAGEENVISGNNTDTNADGINIGNSPTGSILNNKIGVGANGSTPLGNGGYGILFANSASGVLVDGNTISGNGTDGIYLGNGSSSLTVSNNIIGLTTDGLTALGNTNDGVRITDGTNITISGNTISANGSDGIAINGDQTSLDINTNIIGLNVNGDGDMVLLGDGVTVSSDNTFGNQANGIVLNLVDGSSAGNSITGNLISGNGVFADENTGSVGIGIYINADTRGFTIQDNVIGLEGDEITPQKNINSGIYISALSNSVIGGTGANESNLIGHNGDYGIEKLDTNMNGVDVHANEFDCNEKGGISFTSVPDIDAPTIDLVSPSFISGTTTAEDNSNIFIYEADSCASDQGLILVTEAIDAVSGGAWSVAGSFDPTKSYVSVVVDDETGVNATISASEFSTAASVPASIVTNVNDTGTGSLREAINFANANPGTTITFDIAGAGPWVIGLSTALPQITANSTIIDGFTQPGWIFGDPNAMVQINGSGIGGNANGINIDAAGAEVYGLIFTGFLGNSTNGNVYLASDLADNAFIGSATKGNIFHGSGGNAIYIVDGDSTVIQGNRIGTLDGTNVSAMGDHGISTTGEITDLIIGGDFFTGEGNLISGAPSFRYGLNLFGSGGGSGLSNVKIAGNRIGTNEAADGAIPNTLGGINILGTVSAVEIGGPSPSDLNIISGNGDHGIIIQAGNTFDIDGNYIGLQSDGSTALGNAGSGIRINPAAVNVNVGTNSQNIISENTGHGILFDGNTSSNTALGTNIFSCNASGGIGYGSGPLTPGATIDDLNFSSALVTTGAADGSTVYIYYADDGCSNDQGIALAGSGTVSSGQAVVSGGFAPSSNYVALVEDVNGFSVFSSPFFANFVMVTNTNDSGTGSFRAAIDSANTYPGASIYFNIASVAPWEINLASDLPAISAQGTIIDATTQPGWDISTANIPQLIGGGTLSIGLNVSNNFFEVYGLHIRDFLVSGIRFNTTGGAANGYQIGESGNGNIITNSGSAGVSILSYLGGGSIQGNYIGILPDGTTSGMGNTNGISLGTNADNALIGGFGQGNVISNNTTSEIAISGGDMAIIQDNVLGLNPDESAAVGAGNGININGSDGSTIEQNTISGHTTGIRFNNASGHTIIRNRIGVSTDETTPYPNTNGIHMISNLNSDNNIIGSNTNTGDGNNISENTANAILIDGSGNNGNQIQRNLMFNNAGGITLTSGAHNGITPPSIDVISSSTSVTGTGTDGDEIDLYYSDGNGHGGTYLGSATVSGGSWSIGSLGLTNGDQVVATATNVTDGTSEFSTAATFTFNYPVAEGSGEALSFDGTDDLVVIPNDPSFENPNYTLEAWVSITTNPIINETHTFINKGTLDPGLDPNGYSMGYMYDGANYQVFLGHVDDSNVLQPLIVNHTLTLNEWYHIAGLYDGADMILYVNGEEIGRAAAASPDYVGDATDIRLGGYHSSGGVSAGDFINAQIDEVRIWDFARTEGEIRTSLAQKLPGNPSGLIGYYRMDDSGDAANLLDYQGVHNGTISGGTTYTLSGAHLGDYSTFEYSYTAGSGRNLDVFRLENLGTSNLPLHIYRVSGTPANNVVSGFDNVADTAYYGVFAPGQTYDVVDSIGSLTSDRRILYRANGADPTWTSVSGVLGIRLEDDQIYAYGQSGSGQYVTAIDQNPYPTPLDAGLALNFNGSGDQVNMGTATELQITGALTYEFWINTTATTGFVVGRRSSDGAAGMASNVELLGDGRVQFVINDGASASVTVQSSTSINDGSWHHVAVTYEPGTSIRVYVDGLLNGETTAGIFGSLNSSPLPFNLAFRHVTTPNYLAGQLDEVRVWDIALPETNIREHMIGKIDADFDSLNHLVAYYRFDENSGSTAENLAGDTDGTVSGATPVVSGAPQGQGSIYSYDSGPGVLNTAQFGEDINVYYDDATGGIHGYVVQDNPNQLQADGFNNLDQGKYYGVFAPAGQKVDIHMDYSGGNNTNRRIVYRKDASDTAAVGGWERLSGMLNTSDVVDSVFAFNVPGGEVTTAVLNPPSTYPSLGTSDPGDMLSFDGVDDYVDVSHDGDLSIASKITIEAWVRRTRLDAVDVILEKGGDWTNGETNYGIGLNNNANGNMFFFTWNGGGRGTNGVTDFDWHHYAAVASEGDTDPKLYIDGVLQTIDNTFGNATIVLDETTTKNLHIGAQVDPGFDYFSANEIDEIRIWNDTLSAATINAYSNANTVLFHPNYSDLLAYYRFDDGTGSTILEDVFSNNDGTLTNMDENTDWVTSGALAGAVANNALDFDGVDDYVSLTQNPLGPGYTGDFTIEVWVKPTGLATRDATWGGGIIKSNNSEALGDYFMSVLPDGRVAFAYWDQTGDDVDGAHITDASIPEDDWSHIAASNSSGVITIYINGDTATTTQTNTDVGWIVGNEIGRSFTNNLYHWNGALDEIRIWNDARTEPEIQSNILNELVGNEPNLVAYYDFNQGVGEGDNTSPPIDSLYDGTINGNEGALNTFTLNGTTSNWITSNAFDTTSAPVVNNALDFDGTAQYVTIPSSGNQFENQNMTVEAWVNLATPASYILLSENNNGWGFYIVGGQLALAHIGVGQIISTASSVPTNTWTHVAFTYDNGTVRFYQDGIFLDQFAFTAFSGSANSDYSIGARAGQYADQTFDEIRVWTRTLSDGEISATYNSELVGNETGLFAYYNFEDGVGSTTVTDVTSGLNGSLVGMDANTDWVEGPTLNPPSGGGDPLGETFDSDLPTTTDQVLFLGSGLWEGQGVKSAEDSTLANGGTGDAAFMFFGTGNYLTTPTLDGVNQFTFYYRAENAGGNGFVFDVFTSSDGGITFDQEIASDSSNNTTTYKEFNYNFGSPYTGPIRIVYDALGSESGLIDDFFADVPVIRPNVTITTLPVGDTTVNVGDQDVLIYKVQADIANAAAAAEGLYLTIQGADSTDFDLDGFKYYQNLNLDDFGSATLLDSSSWSPGDPVPAGSIGQLFTDFYVPGTTVYFYVTADINASANPGTFNISLPDIEQFGFADSEKFDGGLTAGSNITIQSAPIPDATMTTIAVPGGTINQGSVDNLIYQFTIAATGGPVTKEGMIVAVGGDAVAGDFSANGWKLYESVNADTGIGGATLVGSTNIGDAAPDSVGYTLSGDIQDGDTHYFYLAVDIDSAATVGNSFNVVLWNGDPTESVGIADPKNKVDGGFVDGNTFTIQSSDFTSPTPIISSIEGSPTNANPIPISIDFGEIVVGFDSTDLVIGNGTAQNFMDVDGQNFTLDIVPTSDGSITIDIADSVAQDLAGNENFVASQFSIDFDGTAPNVGVDALTTNDSSPELTGTVDDNTATIDVLVNATGPYSATNNGDGTWTLAAGTITPALTDGTFEVDVTGTDAVGNSGSDATTNELTVDLTAPTVGVDALATNDSSPELTGTVDDNTATIDMLVNATGPYSATNNGDGTWTLAAGNITPALTDGTFEVNVTATDVVGNVGSDATTNELAVDLTAPTVGVDALATNDSSPELTGTVDDNTATIDVLVNATGPYSATNNGDGTWTLAAGNITPALTDGTFEVNVTATDVVGNVGSDATTNELAVDLTAPTVGVDALATNDSSPELTGTVDDNTATIDVLVNATGPYSATNNGDGTWTLAAGNITPALTDGTFEVNVTATDVIGNVGSDATTNELTVDLTAPTVGVDALATNDSSPELTGTVDDNTATIDVMVNATGPYSATNNGDGTWTLATGIITPALTDGIFEVDVTATDAVGNFGSDATTNELTVDLIAPVVTVDEIATSIVSPELTGTVDDTAATLSLTVNSGNYTPSNNGDGTWTLAAGTITPDLTDNTYDVSVTATDAVGNIGSDATTDELIISQAVIARTAINVNSTGFTARWSTGLDVQTYQLDISETADFSTFVSGWENFETTATSVLVSGLDFSSQYYYRVRLVNTASQVSNNSNTRTIKTTVDLPTLADSLALVQIHDAIQPQGLNWGTARLRDWDGVTLGSDRTRVVVVNISGTQASGDMPNPFVGDALTNGGLNELTGMDVSDNQITGLMDFSSTTISTLFVNDNNLEFDDLEPVVSISTLDYANQASLQYNETTDGSPIEVRYTSDYSLTIGTNGAGVGGSANTYSWFRNDVAISSNSDFALSGGEGVILDIDYDNMGEFRTEVTSSLVPGLVIEVDPQIVWAIADMEVSITDVNGDPLTAPFNAYMLETTRTSTGFRVLETLENLTTSTFTFPDVVLGDYITFVESDLELYIPTYFGNVFEWTEADTLFFRSDDVISMIMTEVPDELTSADGSGTLDVLIEEDFGEEGARIEARRRAAKRKCGLRRKRSGGRTGQDDDDFELIAYGETDEDGEFKFGFLPQGKYRFFVEYPGIPLDESSFVEFDVGEEGVSDTDFKLQAFATEDGIEIEIEAVLGVILEYFKGLQIYPNPSSENLNIRYRHLKSSDVTAELVDLSGNRKWSTELRNGFDGELRIDVSDYEEGIYILRFYDRESPNENVVSFRVIVRK